MSDTVKLIIEIPKAEYERLVYIDHLKLRGYIENGIPLDDVEAEIADIYCGQYCENPLTADAVREMILDILDNIGKTESEKGGE